MASGSFRFDRFRLDPGDRQLTLDGSPVELNARYLDALTLLVREQGKLVTKERFLDEVWRGVPVTDEALTQCIRTLRRQLGDEATSPRFIETVPKHGYRFIAPVEADRGDEAPASAPIHRTGPGPHGAEPSPSRPRTLLLGAAGTVGGGVAGASVGLFYGFAAASNAEPGMGAVSVLLVLVCISVLCGLVAGAGVAFGIAITGLARARPLPWIVPGGAVGGLVVGGLGKLIGLDAFNLLFGRSPGDITGATEGVLLGAALGAGAWLASRGSGPRVLQRSLAAGAAAGGVTGLLATLLGGRLMGGSLDLLARQFPGSRLRLDQIGALLGENGFGPVSQAATGLLEGALFGGCVVGAMILARRKLGIGPA